MFEGVTKYLGKMQIFMYWAPGPAHFADGAGTGSPTWPPPPGRETAVIVVV